jgi:hypothetical protein
MWTDKTWDSQEKRGNITFVFSYCKPGFFSEKNGHDLIANLDAGMDGFGVTQYFQSQPGIFEKYDHLALAIDSETDKVVGLLASCWIETPNLNFLYLWTAMVSDDYRGTYLFNALMKVFLAGVFSDESHPFPEVIATKTYNPVVYQILKSWSNNIDGVALYPDLVGTTKGSELASTALTVISNIGKGLGVDIETGVVRNGQASVAPDFFPQMDMSRDPVVNTHFKKFLTRNDQILCVMKIEEKAKYEILSKFSRTES